MQVEMEGGVPLVVAAPRDLYMTQRTAGWITAAFVISQSLCAQTGIRSAEGLRESLPITVTLQELAHIVPKAARVEMEKADRAKLKHQPEQEIDHLRKAVQIDPEYIAARNNLAVRLVATEPAAAIAEWEEAIRLDPHQGLLFNNLAVAYMTIRNLEAAERAARTSVELDRTSERARAVLGVVLCLQRKYTAETSALLERASDDYAIVHVFAAKVFVERGELQKARTHVQAYLSSSQTEFRKNALEMLDFIDRTGQTRESSPDQF